MPDQRAVTGAQSVVADDRDGSNACARVTVSLSLAAFLTSCSLLFPQSEPAPKPPPVEKKITRNDQVILLPKADGSVGAVVVRQDGVEIVLDKAYASAVIEGPGQVRQLIRDPGSQKRHSPQPLRHCRPSRPASWCISSRGKTS